MTDWLLNDIKNFNQGLQNQWQQEQMQAGQLQVQQIGFNAEQMQRMIDSVRMEDLLKENKRLKSFFPLYNRKTIDWNLPES